jgi:hypothetical protein
MVRYISPHFDPIEASVQRHRKWQWEKKRHGIEKDGGRCVSDQLATGPVSFGGPADVRGDNMYVVSQFLDFDERVIFFRFVFDL